MAAWSHGVIVVLGLLVVGAAVPAVDAFRVLGVFPFNARSHNVMFKAMMEALADRGHDVVVLSPFPLKTPRANYTDLDLSKHFPSMTNKLPFEMMTSFTRIDLFRSIQTLAGENLCRQVFQTKHFRDIMSGAHGKFDVVFTEIFGSECWTAVAYKMQLPLIGMATGPDFAHMHERVGSVDNPSYIITTNEAVAGRLTTVWQRTRNVLVYLFNNFLNKWLLQDPSDPVVREYFGEDTPPISELVKRTSLVMVNRHVSVNPARPVNPNVIDVGGLHLRGVVPDSAGLDADLRRWMDGAEHGVVFFTLGSLVPSNTLPRNTIEALLRAFAALPQRVLWKYEDTDVDLPVNVRIASWLPQTAVLAHPKTILFITHGGLMGTSEAVWLGVPMLGIPLFSDQGANIALYTHLGIAESLAHDQLTTDNVLATIRKLTGTDRYRVRAKEIAALYADRPRSAADEAVWWTEYVVRHKGAPHLRPLGADLPLYQYLLLDVVALILVAVIGALLAAWAVLRWLFGALGTSKKKTD